MILTINNLTIKCSNLKHPASQARQGQVTSK